MGRGGNTRRATRRETLRYGALGVSALALGGAGAGVASADGTTATEAERDPRWNVSVTPNFLFLPAVVGDTVVAESATHAYGFARADGEQRWRVSGTSGAVASTGHGRAYVVDGDEVRAIEPTTGDVAWRSPIRAGYPHTLDSRSVDSPFVYDVRTTPERVVAVLPAGLFGFDADTGEPRWSLENRDVLTGPEPADGRLAYVEEGTRLAAYDLRTGERRWAVDPPEPVQALVATDAETAYLTTTGGVVAVDTATGARRWEWTADGAGTFYGRQASLAGDSLLVTGERGGGTTTLFALSTSDGRHRWTFDVDPDAEVEPGHGGPAVSGDTAYLVEGTRTVSGVDLATGERRWSTDVGSESPTGILDVHDGVVYHPADAGVFALDAADGRVRWHHRIRAALYARVHDDTLFVGAHGGRLLAFDLPSGPLDRALSTLETRSPGALETLGALGVLGAGGLLGALWLGIRRRQNREGDATVLREGNHRTVTLVPREGESHVRTAFRGHFDEASVEAFAAGMETWAALGEGKAVCSLDDWGTDPSPWYETAAGEYTILDAEGWEAAAHALVRVCSALDGADVTHETLRADDVFLRDPADGTDAVVAGWGLGDFYRAAWGERSETAAVSRVGRVGEEALAAFAIPTELREVLATATATRPEERYASLADLRVHLRWAAFAR